MSESKWKQIVGKVVSEEAYVSSFELKECYAKAMKLTTIGTNGNGKVTRLIEEVEGLSHKVNEKEKVIELLLFHKELKDKEVADLRREMDVLKEDSLTVEEKEDIKLILKAIKAGKIVFKA
jgi:hypothetical protein